MSTFLQNEKQTWIHKKFCESKDFYDVVIPSKNTKVLEFNQYLKSEKMSYIIYADLESLINKTDGRKNTFEKSSTAKVGEQIPCGYSISTTLKRRKSYH